MPYRGKIQIVGPDPDADGTDQLTEALAAAVEQGWESPLVVASGDEDGSETDDADADALEGDTSGNSGSVLDYRVLGYPGGAFILVVLDGPGLGLEQASLATAMLGRHLTTWSPELLDYRITEVQVVPIDEPHDVENWLPPFEDEEEPPRWPLQALLDDNLRNLGSQYLLAAGVRSLWGSSHAAYQARVEAEDIVTGGNEHPWASELTSALGELLIRAARFEASTGARSVHLVRGGGDPDLVADLLERARRRVLEEEPDELDELDDDAMSGHSLVEDFMRDHELTWNRVPDDEPADQTERRSARQLRALLWAGIRALATLSRPLQNSTNAWQLLARLDSDGDQEVIRLLAELETARVEEDIAEDSQELQAAMRAFAGLWLSISRPDLLSRGNGAMLLDEVSADASALHHLVDATLIMAGPGPLEAALKKVRLPRTLRTSMNDFLLAQRVTEVAAEERDYQNADPYDDMHAALDAALVEADGELLRALFELVGEAVRLTASDANPHRDAEGHISGPDDLLGYLMSHPAEHACVITSHVRDDDRVIRHGALAIVARISPVGAGEMAADLPDLTGKDPRTEPAARDRAECWVTDALRIASEQTVDTAPSIESRDARTLLDAINSGVRPDARWPVERVTSASAEAAAALLHAASAEHRTSEVFLRP